jgi:hypothetical protein
MNSEFVVVVPETLTMRKPKHAVCKFQALNKAPVGAMALR